MTTKTAGIPAKRARPSRREEAASPIRANAKAQPPSPPPSRAMLESLKQANDAMSGATHGADRVLGNADVLAHQWERERADLDLDAFTVSIRVRRLAMLLDEMLVERCREQGVSLNDMLLLFALRRVGEPYCLRPTDILKMHSVTSGTVTYRIDQLIKQDLAERIPDPSDKRGYLVRMTARGRMVVDAAVDGSAQTSEEILRPLMDIPQARETFIEMLRFYERRLERREDRAR